MPSTVATRRSSRLSAKAQDERKTRVKPVEDFLEECEDMSTTEIYQMVHKVFRDFKNPDRAAAYFLSLNAWDFIDYDVLAHRFVVRTVLDIIGLKHEFATRFLDYFEFDLHTLHRFGITVVTGHSGKHFYRILTGFGC